MNRITGVRGKLRALYQAHLWRGRLILVAVAALLVLVVVRVSLPYTIVYSAVYWLGQQGIASQIENIDIDVTRGTFTVLNASGIKNGDTVFNIGKASIDWQWRPLSRKNIHIKEVVLDQFELEASQYADAIVIAGVVVRQGGPAEPTESAEQQPVEWSTALEHIDFKNIGFCYRQYDGVYGDSNINTLIDYCGKSERVSWQGEFNLGTSGKPVDQPSAAIMADGTIHIDQLDLHNNLLDGTLIKLGKVRLDRLKIDGLDDIRIEQFNTHGFALLQGGGHTRHKHVAEFGELAVSGISFKDSNTLEIESVALVKPVLSAAKDSKGAWKFEQWVVQSEDTGDAAQPDTETEPPAAGAFKIKLGKLSISDFEACYQQPETADFNTLDYCITLASIDWNGTAAVVIPAVGTSIMPDINGNLKLGKLGINNNALARDLLALDNFEINGIRIKDAEDLAFDQLILDQAEGLELAGTENRHTVTINNVGITDFGYRDNALAIGSILVKDLGLDIVQGKDGVLDLESWLINKDEPQQKKTQTPGERPPDPLAIRLGELSLDSKRTIQFTDTSVEPHMNIGFKEMLVKVSSLDSSRPDQKSPIEIKARTKRHGTIEINGVAMPFDEKPSFDATGKIVGIDLRVASPKAEQAIGHIIKSGQLDADLKLLSARGQLDSNIALVLHHFKLKAKSKEDAAALDKAFGMPINQSLVLLKDKKDRIKLDIPITGDVNNPEFDPKDAIIKATAKATTVALVTFYTPYGLAFAGGNVLLNLATAMNFDPLVFGAGSSQITDAHKDQLGKLAELLNERPHVHLTLCGATNLSDRDKLFTEIIDPKNIKPVSAERRSVLKQLGSERQEAVKNHLIEVGKITHDRLILCEPEHSDDTESLAGVEISI